MKLIQFTLILALTMTSGAAYSITRTCYVHYELELGNGYGWLTGKKIGTANFQAKGGCGKGVPNRCRRRARDLGLKCLVAHWKSPAKLPAECRSKNISNIPKALSILGPKEIVTIEGADLGHFVYGAPRPSGRLADSQRRHFVTNKRFAANIWAVSTGNTGCAKRVRLQENYRISLRNLHKAKYSVSFKREVSLNLPKFRWRPKRLTQTRTVTYRGKKIVPVTKTGVFLDRSGTHYLKAEDQDTKYLGCGRKAAHNFLRYLGVDVSQAYISGHMKLNSILGRKKWFGNLAVVPKQLELGLKRILKAKGLDKKGVGIRRYRQVTNPQPYIEKELLQGDGPVIALVRDGVHWVVATGAWSPVFTRSTRFRRFMTHDNSRTTWQAWNKYNLKFGAAQTAAIPAAGGVYKPGTMILMK